MNNVNWGFLDGDRANIMAPNHGAGEGVCKNGEWGVAVEDVVVYGGRNALRAWAQSIVDRLPADRDGKPLVTVDRDRQCAWLTDSNALGEDAEERREWTAAVDSLSELVRAVAADPAVASWTLGDDVTELYSHFDDHGGVVGAVKVSGFWVCGEPLHDGDLIYRGRIDSVEMASAVLVLVADRINRAFWPPAGGGACVWGAPARAPPHPQRVCVCVLALRELTSSELGVCQW